MKKLFFVLLAFCAVNIAAAQTTTVYIVRHGEKNLTNPSERDPELSAEGSQRALDLLSALRDQKVDAVFSTNYKRTTNTVAPLADFNRVRVVSYDATKPKDLVEKIKTEQAGKTVIIAGHSNTILEMAEAFGVAKPLKTLTDEDYDNLLKVVITGDKATVTTSKYGAKHNSGN